MKKVFATMIVVTVMGTVAFAQEEKKPGVLSAGLFLYTKFWRRLRG